jgi:hypothetical protein
MKSMSRHFKLGSTFHSGEFVEFIWSNVHTSPDRIYYQAFGCFSNSAVIEVDRGKIRESSG